MKGTKKYRIEEILESLPESRRIQAIADLSSILGVTKNMLWKIRSYTLEEPHCASTDQICKIAIYFHEQGIFPSCTVNDLMNYYQNQRAAA